MTYNEPDSTETIAVLDKNQREKVHVRVLEYHGRQFVDLRIFAGDTPTQKGVALGIEQLASPIEALEQVSETAIEAEDDPLSKRYRAIMAGEEDGEQGKTAPDLNDLVEGATILGGG